MRAKGRYIKNGRFENDFFQKSGFFERNKIIFGIVSFMGGGDPALSSKESSEKRFRQAFRTGLRDD